MVTRTSHYQRYSRKDEKSPSEWFRKYPDFPRCCFCLFVDSALRLAGLGSVPWVYCAKGAPYHCLHLDCATTTHKGASLARWVSNHGLYGCACSSACFYLFSYVDLFWLKNIRCNGWFKIFVAVAILENFEPPVTYKSKKLRNVNTDTSSLCKEY